MTIEPVITARLFNGTGARTGSLAISRLVAGLLAVCLTGFTFAPNAGSVDPAGGVDVTTRAPSQEETLALGLRKTVLFPGLKAAARVFRDVDGIPHVVANNEQDMLMLEGWVHARDRLFQMDFHRSVASGTLAGILGPSALDSDVEMRTMELRRAAERSLPIPTLETRTGLEAYAAGVGACVVSHPLPPEHRYLQITCERKRDSKRKGT